METCKNCHKEIGDEWDQCDGQLTFDADPFQFEIHGDDTKYWDCAGNRQESAMDI